LVKEAHGQLLTRHDAISKTKERLKESYFWPNMDADISEHIKACQRCQTRKDNRPEKLSSTNGFADMAHHLKSFQTTAKNLETN